MQGIEGMLSSSADPPPSDQREIAKDHHRSLLPEAQEDLAGFDWTSSGQIQEGWTCQQHKSAALRNFGIGRQAGSQSADSELHARGQQQIACQRQPHLEHQNNSITLDNFCI